jgi:pseudouridine-5'-monophosphatase
MKMFSEESNGGQRVTHCIFDFDGTLIDSERFLTQAINDVVQKYDKEYDWSLKSRTVGLHLALSGPIIIEELDLPLTVDQFVKNVLKTFEHRMSNGSEKCNFMSGAERLVKHLAQNNVKLAVCTGSTKFTYSLKVKHFDDFFDVGKYFNHIVKAGDDIDVKYNKPHPDPYRVAINRFDPPPDPKQVLVFEDSPTGLASAVSAGCQCVLIPDPRYDRLRFESQATLVIDSLNDFEPQLFGLPKF